MNETEPELAELQTLLDRSIGAAGSHLTSIVEPGRRTLDARRLAADLRGALVLGLATVTASGQPRLSAVDGHFLHARWYFGTSATAVKARHIRDRPAVSAAYTPRDGYGVWAHGTAVRLDPSSPGFARLLAYLTCYYGQEYGELAGEIAVYRLDPHWMVGFAMTDAESAEFEASLAGREQRLSDALAALG
jgi:hypothetical protein